MSLPTETIPLRADHLPEITRLLMLKDYLQAQIALLDQQLGTIFSIGYGVNIQAGAWQLDLQEGTLSHARPDES